MEKTVRCRLDLLKSESDLTSNKTVGTKLFLGMEKPKNSDLKSIKLSIKNQISKLINTSAPVVIYYDSFGKPLIDGFEVSISHCDELYFFGIGPNFKNFGVDIQKNTENPFEWDRFLGHFFTYKDQLLAPILSNRLSISLERAYLGLFSAKEAAYKSFGGRIAPAVFSFEYLDCSESKVYLKTVSDRILEQRVGFIDFKQKKFVLSFMDSEFNENEIIFNNSII